MEAIDREVRVPIEDVQVGDTVEFMGYAVGDRIGGWRYATVTKVYPKLRVLRVEKRIDGALFWGTTIHETRLERNLSRPEVLQSIRREEVDNG